MMKEEEIVAAIAWRKEKLREVEALPPGTELPCHYGSLPHVELCLCNGTGVLVREAVIDDLVCDLETLYK